MAKRKIVETSKAAYDSLKHSEIQVLYEKILWGLGQIGEGTFEEISRAIKVPKDRVWRRMNELLKTGKVFRPGNKKALDSGRLGFTWRLTNPTEPSTSSIERFPKGTSAHQHAAKIIQQSKLFDL